MSTSVDRALDILDTIALTPMRPGELGEKLGVHRSTVVRLDETTWTRWSVRVDVEGPDTEGGKAA